MSNTLSFSYRPLGGAGQIGANSYLFNFPSESFVIDCGILFPREKNLGINYLICDYSELYHTPPHFLILTHMHEDHVGALAHFIKYFPALPIYCSEMVADFVKKKFQISTLNLNIVKDQTVLEREGFKITFHHMEHSTPKTLGLEISFGDDLIYFSSDFRYSKNLPLKFPRAKRKFLFCDSTNIEVENHKTSEASLPAEFDKIFKENKSRIFVTLFSSNIERLATIINSAIKHKRDIILCGRSLVTNYGIGLAHEMVTFSDRVYNYKDYPDPESDNQVVLLSGCQGDLRSALRRVATDEDVIYHLRPSDLFIFSSKTIPGNEKDVISIINALAKKGCHMITAYDSPIHASGHSSKEELTSFYKLFKPTHVIPIHGEHVHLRKHVEFAQKKKIDSYFVANGQQLTVYPSHLEINELESKENIFIHGEKNKEIEKATLNQRRKIAENGLMSCTVILSGGKLIPDIEFIGLPESANKIKNQLIHIISQEYVRSPIHDEKWSEHLRILLRKTYSSIYGYKPITVVKVFDVHR